MLFQNDEFRKIMRFLCPSFPWGQIFVFKFLRRSVEGEHVTSMMRFQKGVVWTVNIWCVFRMKTHQMSKNIKDLEMKIDENTVFMYFPWVDVVG